MFRSSCMVGASHPLDTPAHAQACGEYRQFYLFFYDNDTPRIASLVCEGLVMAVARTPMTFYPIRWHKGSPPRAAEAARYARARKDTIKCAG